MDFPCILEDEPQAAKTNNWSQHEVNKNSIKSMAKVIIQKAWHQDRVRAFIVLLLLNPQIMSNIKV